MVGEEVRRRREELGLTGAQLAQRASMAPSAVSQIETGKRSPSSNSVVKLAEALGVEVGDLFPLDQAPLWSGESAEERRELLSIGPGSEELRRVEHELEPGTSLDEVLAKLTTSVEGALGIALANLVFGEWSRDEASNSAALRAANRIAKKTNTDPGEILKRLTDKRPFVEHRIEVAQNDQWATGSAREEETA